MSFVPVTEEHRSLLARWLAGTHVQDWWGTPETELGLIYDGKGEHEPFLACVNGRPVAYIQAWWPARHPDLGWEQALQPTDRGIDLFIGETQDLGKGFGTLIIRHFAGKLFSEGATRLVIDPDLKNERAIACYRKAGFTPYGTFETEEGRDLLMELKPEDFDNGLGNVQ